MSPQPAFEPHLKSSVKPRAQSVPDLIRACIAKAPDQLAFISPLPDGTTEQMTWGEFGDRLTRLAHALHARGLHPGDRVAIIAAPSPRWELADKAALACGGVVIGIETHAAGEHIATVLETSGVTGLFVEDPALLERIPGALRDRMRFIVNLDGHEFESLLTRTCDSSNLPPVEPDDLATIVFTSGTTGRIKGIPYTHAQVVTACYAVCDAFGTLPPHSVILCWLPLANLFQRMVNLMAAMMGIRIYFVPDPRQIVEYLRKVEPTFFIGVPRFYEKLYQGFLLKTGTLPWPQRVLVRWALAAGHAPDGFKRRLADRLVLRKVRKQLFGGNLLFCITGSAPMPPRILEAYHALGIPLLEAYALSENIVPVAVSRPNAFRPGSVGRVLPPNEVKIGVEGDIWVRGPGVCAGYLGDALVKRDSEGYIATGDYGRLDADGFLYLSGRQSDLIKLSSGRRITPARIESVYRASPYVDQIIVLGHGRRHITALVVPERAAIAAALRGRGKDISESGIPGSSAAVALIQEDFERLNPALSPHEQVHHLALLPQPLSLERGEMTLSLKVRRHVVLQNYAALVETLYGGVAEACLAENE